MREFGEFLSRLFTRLNDVEEQWSERWRVHTNRRTIIISCGLGIAATLGWILVIQPPESFPVATLITVPEGRSLTDISLSLEAQGVVRSALAFRIITTMLGNERTVHAGDYLFKEPRDIFSVARAMSIGAFGLEPVKIRIPEGGTTRGMAIIFANRLERFDPAKFLAQAQPLEGYLFPDTYFFLPNATEDTVIKALRQNFDTQTASIANIATSTGHTLDEIVIMASIIEREAHKYDDRRMISGVLWNRLGKGMPLQVDVTFLYTLGKGTFQLTMKDLTTDSPYNTYTNKGLPPGPIGSPSLDSLEAAAYPTKNNYLFYLADNTGVTHFSKTYQEHLRKKRLYLGT